MLWGHFRTGRAKVQKGRHHMGCNHRLHQGGGGVSSDPGGWAGRGAPPPLDLLPPRVTPSPVPQIRPGYRISRSVCLCSWWRQASRGSLSLSSRPVRPLDDPLHPFAPKAVAIRREMMWAAMGERGPCLAVATNTSVQRISQGKQAVPVSRGGRSGTGERRAGTGGKVAAAHLGQLCRESGRPRVETGGRGLGLGLGGGLRLREPGPGHRGASGPAAQMPLTTREDSERVASGGSHGAEGSPAREGKGQPPACPRPWEGRCAGGHPAPDAPSPSRGTGDYSSDAGKRRAEPGMLARQSGKPAQPAPPPPRPPPPQDHVP